MEGYAGRMSREAAEAILREHGGFIVRREPPQGFHLFSAANDPYVVSVRGGEEPEPPRQPEDCCVPEQPQVMVDNDAIKHWRCVRSLRGWRDDDDIYSSVEEFVKRKVGRLGGVSFGYEPYEDLRTFFDDVDLALASLGLDKARAQAAVYRVEAEADVRNGETFDDQPWRLAVLDAAALLRKRHRLPPSFRFPELSSEPFASKIVEPPTLDFEEGDGLLSSLAAAMLALEARKKATLGLRDGDPRAVLTRKDVLDVYPDWPDSTVTKLVPNNCTHHN